MKASIERELRELEERLLRPEVRASREAVASLLAEDFVELGSSGRRYTKSEILVALERQPGFESRIEGFEVRELAPDTVLVVYHLFVRTGSSRRSSLRSSIWAARDGRWQLTFHQGTRTDLSEGESPLPRLYGELASWFHLLTAPPDYAEEAEFFRRTLDAACDTPPRTLLELGSGGGNNASHLKAYYEMTLVDLSPDMLALSRRLNPECEHVEGDMRTVRLGRAFDAVFIHDAVVYMRSEFDLRRVLETAFVHCRPGGAALFAPDFVRENFRASTDCGGHDGSEQGMRYLEWTWDPDPSDEIYLVDYAYLLRQPDGSMRVEHDRHVEGLFSRELWMRGLEEAGFSPKLLPFEHSELDPHTHEVFVGIRP